MAILYYRYYVIIRICLDKRQIRSSMIDDYVASHAHKKYSDSHPKVSKPSLKSSINIRNNRTVIYYKRR